MIARPGVRRSRPLVAAAFFDAVAALASNMTAEQLEVARLVMVEGRTMAWAGERVGFSRQLVGYHVKQLESIADSYTKARAIEGDSAVPRGWRTITLSGPKALVEKWAREAEEAANKQKKKPTQKGRL